MKKIYLSLVVMVMACAAMAQDANYESRDAIPVEYTWDFTDMYESWDAWKADYAAIDKLVPKMIEYQGKLGSDMAVFEEFSKWNEDLSKKLTIMYCYVSLQQSVDGKNQELNSRMQELHTLFAKIGQATSWVSAEIISIPKATMDKWTKESDYLAQSRFDLMDAYRLEDHVLSKEKSEVLAYYSKAHGSVSGVYNALANADMVYPDVTLSDGSTVKASPVGVRNTMATCTNQEDRKLISEEHRATYIKTKNTWASILSGLYEKRWASANASGYSSVLESYLSGDNIPTEVYQSLIKTAGDNTAPLQKYLSLRKKALKLEKYFASDGMVPLVETESSFNYGEVKEMVKKSLSPMGDAYVNKVNFALENRWVDVYETPGKRAGAFNLGVYGVHPYIMLNFASTLDDAFTLIHELGHCMQSVLSSEKQPFATHRYSKFVAEVASTFNEQLLMHYLLENTKEPEQRIALLIQQIDNIMGTFYRQAWYADWEQQAYNLVEKGMPINESILSDNWQKMSEKYYGDAVDRTGTERHNWMRVMHLYELPYYVYQYATSYSASAKLANDVLNGSRKEKKAAIERYMNFLSDGGSDYPINQLKAAGVDLTTAEPFQAVVNDMTRLVDQLEEELKNAGKI
jgi:oligoendopeptidase F